MPLLEIKQVFERRRMHLINLLESNQHIEQDRQNQIYGAIREIENFLNTLDYHIELNTKRELFQKNKPELVLKRDYEGGLSQKWFGRIMRIKRTSLDASKINQ